MNYPCLFFLPITPFPDSLSAFLRRQFEDGHRETNAHPVLLSDVNVLPCGHLERVSFDISNGRMLNL